MNHECGLDVTYCDDCETELEAGQTGQCEDCQPPKEYTFSQLSDAAKEKARDALRYSEHYLYDEWWDSVYEDAARVATILGLDITERCSTANGKIYQAPAINFSGFSSQGDGACFRGSYRFNSKAVDEISAYCSNAELVSMATALHTLQLVRRLHGLEPFSAEITTSGNYSHSGAMSVIVNAYDINGEDDEALGDLDDEVTQIMHDFADWIYKSLETEHDYLMSDEVVDEQLVDEMFDVEGHTI